MIRARIVLLAAAGRSHRQIAKSLGVRAVTVTRWLRRFSLLGPQGLLRDAPRSVARSRLSPETIEVILRRTLRDRPSAGHRWTTRSLGREVGVSHTSVLRVWKRFGVRPNTSRLTQLVLSGDGVPRSVDVSGVLFDPPRWAITLSLSRHPAPRAGGGSGRSALPARAELARSGGYADLATTLRPVERRHRNGSWRSLVDQEFLAFLNRVARAQRPEERLLLITGADNPLSISAARWLGAHPEITTRTATDVASVSQKAPNWTESVAGTQIVDSALPSLAKLQGEVRSWTRAPRLRAEPFAWVRE